MEICLAGDDIDAETCERWGYLNRIFDCAETMSDHVDALARRIAGWPSEAIALCKASINNAELPIEEGLLKRLICFSRRFAQRVHSAICAVRLKSACKPVRVSRGWVN